VHISCLVLRPFWWVIQSAMVSVSLNMIQSAMQHDMPGKAFLMNKQTKKQTVQDKTFFYLTNRQHKLKKLAYHKATCLDILQEATLCNTRTIWCQSRTSCFTVRMSESTNCRTNFSFNSESCSDWKASRQSFTA